VQAREFRFFTSTGQLRAAGLRDCKKLVAAPPRALKMRPHPLNRTLSSLLLTTRAVKRHAIASSTPPSRSESPLMNAHRRPPKTVAARRSVVAARITWVTDSALMIEFRLHALFWSVPVKKILHSGQALRLRWTRMHRAEKFSTAKHRVSLAEKNYDSKKTLDSRGFLRSRRIAKTCSPVRMRKRFHASLNATKDRATLRFGVGVAHFLLRRFGVFHLLLYKLQRDARRIGCASLRHRQLTHCFGGQYGEESEESEEGQEGEEEEEVVLLF